jgi:hypothetical protein
MLPGPNPGDKEIDVFSTEGPTREYLQRKPVTLKRYPWEDLGAYQGDGSLWPLNIVSKKQRGGITRARLAQIERVRAEFGIKQLMGDRIAMTISQEVIAPWLKPNPLDDVEFTRGKREDTRKLALFGEILEDDLVSPVHCYGPSVRLAPQPAEVCYVARQRTDRQYDSWQQFEQAAPEFFSEPKLTNPPRDQTTHWDGEFALHLAEQKRLFDIDAAPIKEPPK